MDALIDYIERHSGKWVSEKTVRRDMGNLPANKRLHPIADWRVRLYAKWLSEEVGQDQAWLAKWLDYTAYPAPGKLLAELYAPSSEHPRDKPAIKTNVPALKNRLWGRFLGRQTEHGFETALQGFLNVNTPYYTALTYTSLARLMIGMAEKDFPEGIDPKGDLYEIFAEVETYIDDSDRHLARYHEHNAPDLYSLNLEISNRISRGTLARIRGQLDEGRVFFLACLGHCPSLFNLARVHFELALLEHFAGNRSSSQSYEEKAHGLFQQLAVIEPLPNWYCLQVIEHLKQAGQW